MNDDELGQHLRDLPPAPGPTFWAGVDERLAGDRPHLRHRRPRRLLLATAAAVAVAAAGSSALLAWSDRDTAIDATADGTPPTAISDPAATGSDPGPGTDPATGPVGSEPTLGPIDTRPGPGTTCFGDGPPEVGDGPVLRLDVFDDGLVSAMATDPMDGPQWVAAGRFVTGTDLLVTVSDTTSSRVRLWSWSEGKLATAEDVVYVEKACGDLPEVTTMQATAVGGGAELTVEPGRRCFTATGTPVAGHYRVDVTDAGTATVTGRSLDAGRPTVTRAGTGFFATATELVLLLTTSSASRSDTAATIWTVGDDTLAFTDLAWTAAAADCAGVDPILDAAALAGADAALAEELATQAEELVSGATIRVDERIAFAPGTSAATVDGAVVRGERARYRVEAAAGQTMRISAGAVEDNVGVALISPSGQVLVIETTGLSLELPEAGDYQLLVGPSRGNATYTLTVEITGP